MCWSVESYFMERTTFFSNRYVYDSLQIQRNVSAETTTVFLCHVVQVIICGLVRHIVHNLHYCYYVENKAGNFSSTKHFSCVHVTQTIKNILVTVVNKVNDWNIYNFSDHGNRKLIHYFVSKSFVCELFVRPHLFIYNYAFTIGLVQSKF
jgi:hypothetical protein